MENSHSPLPKEAKETVVIKPKVGWGEMCQALLEGKHAKRPDWDDEYLLMHQGQLSLFKEGKHHQLISSEEDISAQDWEIIN